MASPAELPSYPRLEAILDVVADWMKRYRYAAGLRAEPGLRERLAQLGHVRLHHLLRRARGPLAPEIVDDPVPCDRLVRVEQEERQERPRLAGRDRERRAAIADFHRAE